MTIPAPPAAAPASTPSADTAAGTVLAARLSSVLLEAVTPEQAMSRILSYSRDTRIEPAAMMSALQLVMAMPQERTGASGPASLAAIRVNMIRRAQFAVSSALRLTSDIRSARSRGQSARQALSEAIPRERRFFGQHIEAGWTRAVAAARVDSAASSYGPVLGWHTVRDRHTSPDCLAAGGKNFRADVMPAIGWPGAVHPHCRCYPGPPLRGARMLRSTYGPAAMVSA